MQQSIIIIIIIIREFFCYTKAKCQYLYFNWQVTLV